ncbi:MAG: hypothetical protein PHX26_07580, partial [Proteiniphilum sp.]|nr:hypothetical protein [Proteiniphilum sp.]
FISPDKLGVYPKYIRTIFEEDPKKIRRRSEDIRRITRENPPKLPGNKRTEKDNDQKKWLKVLYLQSVIRQFSD